MSVWVDSINCSELLAKWGLHTLYPEEIAHTINHEATGVLDQMTETWPLSLLLVDQEDTASYISEQSVADNKVEEFLMSIAPSVRKKNLSMVQGRNDWISKQDGSIEPMNAKKWHLLDKSETRSVYTAGESAPNEDQEGDDDAGSDDGMDDEELGDDPDEDNQGEEDDGMEEEDEDDEDDDDDDDDDDLDELGNDDDEDDDEAFKLAPNRSQTVSAAAAPRHKLKLTNTNGASSQVAKHGADIDSDGPKGADPRLLESLAATEGNGDEDDSSDDESDDEEATSNESDAVKVPNNIQMLFGGWDIDKE